MSSPGELTVSTASAFARGPDIDAALLTYPNLCLHAEAADRRQNTALAAIWDTVPDTVQESAAARTVAIGNLVLMADRLQGLQALSSISVGAVAAEVAQRQRLVSERFTQSAAELYGAPDPEEARSLAYLQLRELEQHVGNPRVSQANLLNVINFWQKTPPLETLQPLESRFVRAREAMHAILDNLFGDTLHIFDRPEREQETLAPGEIATLYSQALASLTAHDLDWQNWHVEQRNKRYQGISVQRQAVIVGNPTLQSKRARPLFYHEVLGHALRAVNGSKTGDELMREGLPFSLPSDEGWATFMEYIATGVVPVRALDRYIDIAAARGAFGRQVTRKELHQLYLDRLIVRGEIAGDRIDIDDLTASAWSHVDRIYKGSLGNNIIAINPIDISYYSGFKSIGEYITNRLEQGVEPLALYRYLTAGNFDPTISQHVRHAATLGIYEP